MRKRLTDQAVKAAKPSDSTVIIWDELLTGFGLRINAGGRKAFVVKGRADGWQFMNTVGGATRIPLAAARDKARSLIADGPDLDAGLLSFDRVADRFRRRQEVGGMRWPEIDGDLWTIAGERTKSGRSHEVPLSDLVRETLNGVPYISDQTYLFSSTGKRPISGWSNAKRHLDKATEIESWRFHDIRRSVASGMARMQIDRLTISRVLGHAERGVAGPVYIRHGYLKEKAQALQRWADELAFTVGQ